MKYNCTRCGAGCYSADESKTLCAECERDENMAKMRSPEEIEAKIKVLLAAAVAEYDAEYNVGWIDALEWVLEK